MPKVEMPGHSVHFFWSEFRFEGFPHWVDHFTTISHQKLNNMNLMDKNPDNKGSIEQKILD